MFKIGDVVTVKDSSSAHYGVLGKVVNVNKDNIEVLFDGHLWIYHESCLKHIKEETEDADIVNHPPHYCQDGGLECIDVMQLMFGKQAVIDFCKCNIFKYRFRSHLKNGKEDIAKAQWYERKLQELSK